MIYFNFSSKLVQLVTICAILILIPSTTLSKSLIRVPRIIGGLEAEPNEFPYIVSLQIKGSHKCGGSILNSEWIITAAHCFRRTIPHTWYSIVAGQIEIPLLKSKGKSIHDKDYNSEDLHHSEYDQSEHEEFLVDENEFGEQNSTENSQTQVSHVIQLISHPQWSPKFGLANDIALLRISPPLNFTQNVQPIPFAHSGFTPEGNGTAVGWGVTDEDDFERSEHLRKVDLPLVNDSECRDNYNSSQLSQSRSSEVVFKIEIVDSMICAGSEGLDSCRFDSGGPLICDENEKHVLCGITSWGNGCGVKNFPGVYTEVSYYYDWIINSTTNSTIQEFTTSKSTNATQSSS